MIQIILFNAGKGLRKTCYKTPYTENMYRFLLMTTTAKAKILLTN